MCGRKRGRSVFGVDVKFGNGREGGGLCLLHDNNKASRAKSSTTVGTARSVCRLAAAPHTCQGVEINKAPCNLR